MAKLKDHQLFYAFRLVYLFPVFYVFCLPFQRPFPKIIIIAWAVYLIFRGNHQLFLKNLKKYKVVLLSPAIYIINIISAVLSEDTAHAIAKLETKLGLLFIPIFLLYLPIFSNRFIRDVFRSFVMGILSCLVVCSLLFDWSEFNSSSMLYVGFSQFMHTSYFALCLDIAIASLMFYPFRILPFRTLQTNQIIKIGLIGFLSLFVFLLSSKAGIIALAFLFLIKALSFIQWKNRNHWVGLVGGIIIVGVISVNNPRVQSLITLVDKTLHQEELKVSESNTLRLAIWPKAYDLFEKAPWIGVGLGDADQKLIDEYKKEPERLGHLINLGLNAHNTFLQEAINAGIFALSLLLSFLFGVLWNKRFKLLAVAFFLLFFINFLTESMLEKSVGISIFCFFYPLLYLMQERLEEKQLSQ